MLVSMLVQLIPDMLYTCVACAKLKQEILRYLCDVLFAASYVKHACSQ